MAAQGKVVTEAVSQETWNKLDEEWGTTAKGFRELNFLRDYPGLYPHDPKPSDADKWSGTSRFHDNKKISLLQIRYGSISGSNEEKPCIWFLFRHEQDPAGQISDQTSLRILVHVSRAADGKSAWEPIGRSSQRNVITKVTQHGLDIYALVAKVFEPDEWSVVETQLQATLAIQPVLVRMTDTGQYTGIGGIWKVEGGLF